MTVYHSQYKMSVLYVTIIGEEGVPNFGILHTKLTMHRQGEQAWEG